MTDETKKPVPKGEKFSNVDALEAVNQAINDIKASYYGYGNVIVNVSGREIKHVNVEVPYRGRPER